MALALGVLVQLFGEGAQPGHVGVGVGGVLDLVLGVEEVGGGLVGAGQLADHIGAGAEAATAEIEGADRGAGLAGVTHRVVVDLFHRRQPRTVDSLQPPQLVGVERAPGGDAGGGFVAEPPLQVGVGPLVEAELGRAFRAAAKVLLEEGVEQGAQPRAFGPGSLGGAGGQGREGRSGGGGEDQLAAVLHDSPLEKPVARLSRISPM